MEILSQFQTGNSNCHLS